MGSDSLCTDTLSPNSYLLAKTHVTVPAAAASAAAALSRGVKTESNSFNFEN